jgi:hypothetical protein
MRRHIVAALVLLFAAPANAQLLELQPGARVRVMAPAVLGGKLEGTIAARRGDTLSILAGNVAPVDIPISALSRVEIYRGTSRTAGAKKGLLWGLALGLPAGVLTAAGDNKTWNRVKNGCDPAWQDCTLYTDVEQVMLMTAGSGAIGAGIGALIGRQRWETLQIPALPVVTVGPHGVLIETRVSLPFRAIPAVER